MAKETEKDMATVVELLIDKIAQLQAGGGGLTTEQLETLLQKTAGNTAEAFRAALIPENKIHPNPVSAYSYPEGETARPKPKLALETMFCGRDQRWDNLTPEEVLAFNALVDGGPYEARNGVWKAWIQRSGTKATLMVYCDEAADRDRARDLPPMLNILYELKDGPQAVDLATLRRELEDMQRKLAQAEAGAAA